MAAGTPIPPVVWPIAKGAPSTRVVGCCVVVGQGRVTPEYLVQYLVRLQTNYFVCETCTTSSRFISLFECKEIKLIVASPKLSKHGGAYDQA